MNKQQHLPQQYNPSSIHSVQHQNARKIIENYSYGLNDQIGKGFSSKVFKGKNDITGDLVAVKVIDLQMLKTPLHHQLLRSEIDALTLTNHPNIMKLYKVFSTSNNTYLITEYCETGDLGSLIQKKGKQPEQFIQNLMLGIVQGYKEMKNKGIIHRDIKPANILLSKGIPKIADFGFATTPRSPPMLPNVNVGSPLYMSPQALKQNKYSDKSDIFAIGITAYELLCGKVPWQAGSEKDLAQKMISEPVQFPQDIILSQECQDFIRKCLLVDVNHRIAIEEMELHSWISSIGQTKQQPKLLQTPGNHLQSKHFSKHLFSHNQKTTDPMDFLVYTSPLGDARNKDLKLNLPLKIKNDNTYFGKENLTFKQRDFNETNSSQANPKTQQLEQNAVSSVQPIYGGRQNSSSTYQGSNKLNRQSISNTTYLELLTSESTKRNDNVLLSQINFCRFLNRVAILLEKVSFLGSNNMKEKLTFFVQKNIMIKIHKLKEMIGIAPSNSFNLICYNEYLQGQSYSKISQVIQSYYQKFSLNFSAIWLTMQQQKSILKQDKKFDAVFDENLTEFESFYIILHNVLRGAVRELDIELSCSLKENEQQLPLGIEDGVVLLDYLVTYFQLTALILDQFNKYEVFAQQSKIEQIADGVPVRLNYGHFLEIRNKIQQLKI